MEKLNEEGQYCKHRLHRVQRLLRGKGKHFRAARLGVRCSGSGVGRHSMRNWVEPHWGGHARENSRWPTDISKATGTTT